MRLTCLSCSAATVLLLSPCFCACGAGSAPVGVALEYPLAWPAVDRQALSNVVTADGAYSLMREDQAQVLVELSEPEAQPLGPAGRLATHRFDASSVLHVVLSPEACRSPFVASIVLHGELERLRTAGGALGPLEGIAQLRSQSPAADLVTSPQLLDKEGLPADVGTRAERLMKNRENPPELSSVYQ